MSVSPYLLKPARALREVCQEAARDPTGRQCRECPLEDICTKQPQTRGGSDDRLVA